MSRNIIFVRAQWIITFGIIFFFLGDEIFLTHFEIHIKMQLNSSTVSFLYTWDWRVRMAVMLLIYTWEVLGLNLNPDVGYCNLSFFRDFPQFLQENTEVVSRLGHDLICPSPYRIIRLHLFYAILYSLATNSAIK
jgi:hypothetical protein